MHLLLLIVWTTIAALLRFVNLDTKPLWADEFSTLVFSLGNSYRTIPLDRILTWQELLQPIQPTPQTSMISVVQHLGSESNHPPLYFLLTHLWLKLFSPTSAGLVSVWAARSLSAWFGVAAVPAMFGLGWVAFRSRLIAHLSALLMVLSPFGIYLAQEARHYTLAVLLIVASLSCLVVFAQKIRSHQSIPLRLCLTWIAVNGLGIATHFFVLLTLLAEAIALSLWLFGFRQMVTPFTHYLRRLMLVALGTIAMVLIWLPVLLNIRGTELTRWIQVGEFDRSTGLDHLLRSLAGLVSMLYLLPVQGVSLSVIMAASLIGGLLLLWTIPLLWRGWQNQVCVAPEPQSTLLLITGFVGVALGLSWLLTFGGINFASVFRYQFIHFPGVMLVLAASLSDYWPRQTDIVPGLKFRQISGRTAIAIVLVFSLLGGMTVTAHYGYQRTHRPDQVAAAIAQSFQRPTLVAIPYKTHAQTGRLMAIAWELARLNPTIATQTTFLLANYPGSNVQAAIVTLQKALQAAPRPLDVWRVNFRSQANALSHAILTQENCVPATELASIDGYRYQRYTCERVR
jgi:uncharacterized membrane protein